MYDVIIVGGGPAGLTAGIYLGRGRQKVLIIEKEEQGSLYMAHKIDNFPGFPQGITGKELNLAMKEQSKRFNVEFVNATLLGFDPYSEEKIVKTDRGNFIGKNIIVATGNGKNFGKKIKGEKEFLGKGVSYCATCDGAFTKNFTVSLVGQGEELAEEALFLTKYSKKINIFVTEDEFKCEDSSLEALKSNEKVEIITGVKLLEIKGEEFVQELLFEKDGKEVAYPSDFAFLYLGTKNNVEMYGEFASLDKDGAIITKDNFQMNIDGMYAIGDIRSGAIKQVTVATAEGTMVALEIMKKLLKNRG